MPKFRITGFDRNTNRKRKHTYQASNLEKALTQASKDGIIVDSNQTEVLPDETQLPASENQIRYAKELGLTFSENISKSDISKLLDESLREKKYQKIDKELLPTESQIELMKEKGFTVPKNITRRDLSKIIDKILEQELDNVDDYHDTHSVPQEIMSKLSREALHFVINKPFAWEHRLFSQILCEEIHHSAYLKKDLEYGLIFDRAKRLHHFEDVLELHMKKSSEIMSFVEASNKLINVALTKSIGEQGKSGDAEEIIYVGQRLGDIYQTILKRTIEFKKIQVDEKFKHLFEITLRLYLDIITGIEAFSSTLQKKLFESTKKYEQTKEHRSLGTINLNIINISNLSELNDEMSRISKSL